MELFRFGAPGKERPAVRHEGREYDLTALTADLDGSFFETDGIERVAAALAADTLDPVDTAGQRIGAPIARPPAVVCIGMNYAAHATESGAAPPQYPVVFLKHPGCVVGPDDDVILPLGSTKTDWEVELAVVMKRTPRHLTDPADALDYVAGYALANDLSERAFQIEVSGGQWSKGKCAETFNPLGPVLRPASELDPGRLRLRSWVNGEPRQDSSTADMIFSVPDLIVHLSQHMLLMPGDVVNTGTPEGVALSGRFPYLRVGDVVALEIEGLGRQEQTVVGHRPAG
ncbi:2-keto-4-pentenoate hydratase/2-oxohepta-3-ene-1,7-dioic acid hydratase (catechol pathway) [Micromonospora haikouensis]|uniref:2-keto-4-pentenoate hydratase/2-oxohepta-3-ene-1,7-dioic acid hydratase (Catechol pathway) n=1 Tax=Micromonospora haikouensis TaxID=686309 RepID=A0A1C4YD01_9ACTN|nr:fumarylacetoacetate hydrolase family protein [Micromonospora haikouensis]SCF18578.1 2-keto-4-pentenoate hydratase/2-oxohepta-3-ene-1,7-dioic acid hydratase (catechol pathway) [Micromonospora haikouensis]